MQDSLFPDMDYSYSLSEISEKIREVISINFNRAYWVKAEILKLNYHEKSGHCFPELVEKADQKIKAKAKAVIWAGDFQVISKRFREVTREQLKDSMQVLLLARVKYDALYGLSLQILDIDPSFTLGSMAREKQKAIELLKEEGIFDANRKRTLPLLLKSLAVISVESGKGYHDFVNIIRQYEHQYRVDFRLYSAVLQGENAVPSIIRQLRMIAKNAMAYDAVVLIRGGGDELDLNCYEKYELAREVALFPLPIITGIGHSTNETVTEMVAYNNKITPTDVAYYVVNSFHAFEERIKQARMRIISRSEQVLSREKYRFQVDVSRFVKQLSFYRQAHSKQIQLLTFHLKNACSQYLYKNREMLKNAEKGLSNSHKKYIHDRQTQIGLLSEKIKLLDPAHVLKRGYSISRINGKAITFVDDLKEGQIMTTEVFSGELKSMVQKIKKKDR